MCFLKKINIFSNKPKKAFHIFRVFSRIFQQNHTKATLFHSRASHNIALPHGKRHGHGKFHKRMRRRRERLPLCPCHPLDHKAAAGESRRYDFNRLPDARFIPLDECRRSAFGVISAANREIGFLSQIPGPRTGLRVVLR